MVTGLIDLDARPEPARPRAPDPRVRPVLLVAAVAALLAALGGAAPPAPGPAPVLTMGQGINAVTVGGRSFFAAGQGRIGAYDLPSGAARWSRQFTQEVYALTYDQAAAVLVVTASGAPTTVLDAASGRLLWAAADDGGLVLSVGGGTVLTRTDHEGGPSTLRVDDIRTGRRIWQRDVDRIAFVSPEGVSEEAPVLAITASGSVVVLRSADGTVIGRGDLGVPLAVPADLSTATRFVDITTFGGRLYLSDRNGVRTTLSAYSIEPFRRLWRVEDGPAGRVTDCGPVLCVNADRTVNAVDPADGRPRWSQPAYAIGFRYDDHTVFATQPGGEAPAALLDAATGRPRADLGDSRRLGAVILRTDRSGRIRVSVPDATGTPRLIGPIDAFGADRCEAATGYLACPVIDGRTRLWRLPTT
jgi:outer membrane protein assembly factor BamB